jgi:hypothetical protein
LLYQHHYTIIRTALSSQILSTIPTPQILCFQVVQAALVRGSESEAALAEALAAFPVLANHPAMKKLLPLLKEHYVKVYTYEFVGDESKTSAKQFT